MSSIDERKNAFENKFAHDEDLQFKASARRNKLLGLWAADKMHKKDDDAVAYAKEVVIADFEEVGDDDVLRKVFGDLQTAGIHIEEGDVRREMDRLLGEAKEQIMNEV